MSLLIMYVTAAVRKEISDETDRETGRSKMISSVPIHLSIYSPNGKIMDIWFVLVFIFILHSWNGNEKENVEVFLDY